MSWKADAYVRRSDNGTVNIYIGFAPRRWSPRYWAAKKKLKKLDQQAIKRP